VRFAASFWRSSSSASSSVSSGGSTPTCVTPASDSFWPSSKTLLGVTSFAAYDRSIDTKICNCLRSTPSSMRTAPTPHCRSTPRMCENDA